MRHHNDVDDVLSNQIGRIDDAMHVIQLYIASREECAPALSLAWRELDGVRDDLDQLVLTLSEGRFSTSRKG